MDLRGGQEFGELVAALRLAQDAITSTDAPAHVLRDATAALQEAAALLASHEAADGAQHAGLRLDLPGRGHPLLAPFLCDRMEDDRLEGRVTLTRTHLSGGGHAHAGAVALLLGEVLGVLSVLGGRHPARNAALHVNYRRATPSGVELTVRARVVQVEGRKITVVGEVYREGVVVADAEGLYLRTATQGST